MRLAEWLAAHPEGATGEAFNFSNETQLTVLGARRADPGTDGQRPRARRPERGEPRDPRAVPDAAKARATLGWAPLFTLDEGLERTIAWYREAAGGGGMTVPPCRSCGGRRPRDGALARQDAARELAASHRQQLDEPEPTYPLDLAFCPACSLVQITETVPPECSSATTSTSRRSPTRCCATPRSSPSALVAERDLGPESLVVEAASNDGYLLGVLPRARRRACSASSPRRNIAARRGGARHPHDRRVLRLRARGATRARGNRAPTSSTRTTCSPTSRT